MSTTSNDPGPRLADEHVIRRISSEFLEMPGLRITSGQAQRLFGLAEGLSAALLEELVARGVLTRRPDGSYVRVSECSAGVAAFLRRTPEAA